MWRLSVRVIVAMFVEFLVTLAFFTLLFWVLGRFFDLKLLGMLAYGVFFTVILIFIEWLLGPSMVSSTFNARWIERSDDPVLWSMVHEEAKRAGVKVRKIGILDNEVPNALAYSFITGRPHLVFSKELMMSMTYPEMRAVACYLIGSAKSGGLNLMTMLSGLLTVPYQMVGGFVGARLEGRRPGPGSYVAAGLSYLLFIVTYPQSVMISRIMTIYSDEFSIEQTGDPSRFLSALMKVSAGCASRPVNLFRAKGTPLKCLMFQDPTTAIRDAPAMKESATKWGINLERVVDLKGLKLPEVGEVSLHAFEKFWSHQDLVDRIEHAVEFGKKVQSPIKIGLNWIE